MTETAIVPSNNNSPAVFRDDVLADITSFDDALKAIQAAGVTLESSTDYGNGFALCDSKDSLIGVDFIIMDWRFNPSDKYDGDFVSMNIVTKDGRKLIVNDGSTGIRDQLRLITNLRLKKDHPHPQSGLAVAKGLTRSDYRTEVNGKMTAASTYYLSE